MRPREFIEPIIYGFAGNMLPIGFVVMIVVGDEYLEGAFLGVVVFTDEIHVWLFSTAQRVSIP